MLEKVEETVEKKPDKAVMDAGYYSRENLEKAEKLRLSGDLAVVKVRKEIPDR